MTDRELVERLGMQLSDRFIDGRYKGETIKDVYLKDSGYISWLISKTYVDTAEVIPKNWGTQSKSLYAEDLEEYYNQDNIDESNPLDFYENDFISY